MRMESSFISLVEKTNTVVSMASMIGVHATVNMTILNSTCCLLGGGGGGLVGRILCVPISQATAECFTKETDVKLTWVYVRAGTCQTHETFLPVL